jgi:hypothetical protein
MKKILIVVIINLLFILPAYSTKIAVLKELTKPETLCLDESQYYITEGVSVWIYSLRDHKLVGKFGKAGEGPREFKATPGGYGLRVFPLPDQLLVNSFDKLSFFNKKGEFSREMKVPMGVYQPRGEKFVGLAFQAGADQSMAITVNLFNEKLEKGKEIYSRTLLQRGSMVFPVASPIFEARNGRIFIGGEEEFVIRILDAEGNPLSSIARDYKRVKVTEEYRQGVFETFKKNPVTKGMVDYLKQMIKFKEYFPAILSVFIDGAHIYIQTYRKQQEKYEIFIYDTNGKYIKQVYLPIRYVDTIQPYPFAIKNGILYQLIENEENEVWELHANEIK